MKDQVDIADGRYRLRVTLPSGKIKYVYGTKEELEQKRKDMLLSYAQKRGGNIEK